MLLLCSAECLGAFADFQSVGGTRINLDGVQYIIPQLNFSCDGTVTQWKVGLENGGTNRQVLLQIWRSVGVGDYIRVTEVLYTKTGGKESIGTVSVSMSVKSGDIVGFHGQLHTLPDVGLTIYSSEIDPTSSLSGLDTAVGPSPYITVVFGE